MINNGAGLIGAKDSGTWTRKVRVSLPIRILQTDVPLGNTNAVSTLGGAARTRWTTARTTSSARIVPPSATKRFLRLCEAILPAASPVAVQATAKGPRIRVSRRVILPAYGQ